MFNHALKALRANKLKTILIYLSLIFSIVAIFLITSISNGIISMYSNMLKSDGDIIITQAKISDTFFSNVDIKLGESIKNIGGVSKVSSLIVGASPVENIPIVAVYGVSQNRFKNYEMVKGIYPKENEVIVGKNIYEQLKDKSNIQIANKNFNISGFFESEIGFENGGVVLNIEDAGEIFNKSASMLLVNIDIASNIDEIIEKISKLSSKIDVKSTNSFVDNYNQFEIINKSSLIISFIAFSMGLLSIASIMSITINERKDEFGIKRALGISTPKIVSQIVLESFILGLLSFITAFFISTLLLFIIKNIETLQGYVSGEISPTLSLYVFFTSIFMTILGSIVPAFSAAKTDPIILIQGGVK